MNKLFNWKEHPASVFYLAFPIAALAIVLLLARAVIEWYVNGNWGYAVLFVFFIALGVLALLPAYRLYAAVNRKE